MSFLTKLPRDRYSSDAFAGFRPTQDGFDLGIAKAMAWMCQLAYETDEPAKVADIAAPWGMETRPTIISAQVATVLPMASTQLVVGRHGDTPIIAFAGTDPLVLADWITDFNIAPSPQNTAEGFAVAAEAVAPELDKVLQNAPENRPVFVTGHSLGGALAVLAADRINAKQPGRIRAVYTFGMPRAGGSGFATAYNQALGSCTYRLVHGDDVVPTVAPSSLGFQHVGRYLQCERHAKFSEQALASTTGSDEPKFGPGITKQLTDVVHRPLSAFMSAATRLKIVAALGLGVGPTGMRTDVGGLVIELLPPPLRDHMPDRYIEAT